MKELRLGNPLIRIFIVEGGCEGCALEAQAALAARYGAVRRGIVPAEAPAHADVLVLCGPAPVLLDEEVRRLTEALPEPWACVCLGDCALEQVAVPGLFVPGCPPRPEEVLAAVRRAWEERRLVDATPSGPAEEAGP